MMTMSLTMLAPNAPKSSHPPLAALVLVARRAQTMQPFVHASSHGGWDPNMNQFTHPEGLSMLEKRRIEAEILKEVYETLKESHGEEVAKKTIAESVRRSAIDQAPQFAAAALGGTSLKAFQECMPPWPTAGALEMEAMV